MAARGAPMPAPLAPGDRLPFGVVRDEAVLVDGELGLEPGRLVAPPTLAEAGIRLAAVLDLERREQDPRDADIRRLADREPEAPNRQGVRRGGEAEIDVQRVRCVDDD